jgi:glycosidase
MQRIVRTVAALSLVLAGACSGQRQDDVVTPPRPPRDAIYEVFTRDFSPAGNFQGVMDGLDRIQATGANVIWLMPIHPVGVKNRKEPLGSSYSVVDYRAINPDYGSEADFRRLVKAVHARGMKIIIDWVPNHTAWDHVWVSKHPARYIRDAQGAMSTPRDNEGKLTDWTDVADLDYSNADLRKAMIEDMKYWLDEFDIDGFRVDVAGMVPDDFWRAALPELRQEESSIVLLAEWGDLKMHNLGYDLSYGWDSYGALKAVWKGEPANKFVEQALADQAGMPPGGARLRFTTNHDETAWDAPPITLFGGAAGARAAFVAVAFLPGVVMLYNGQEVESPQKLGLFAKEAVAWDQPNAAKALAFYRRVIDLTRTHDAFGEPMQAFPTDAGKDVIAYRRGNVVVLVNTRGHPIQVGSGVSLKGAHDLLSGGTQQEHVVQLAGYGTAVLELKP